MAEKDSTVGRSAAPFLVVESLCFDLSEETTETFHLRASSTVSDIDDFLVVDIYDTENEVHPEGHRGWWSFGFGGASEFDLCIARTEDGIRISSPDISEKESWINPDFDGLGIARLTVHILIRKRINNEIEFKDSVCLYQSQEALQEDLARQRLSQEQDCFGQAQVDRWFVWPKRSKVFVAATEIREHDAVGDFAHSISALLSLNGIENGLHADRFDVRSRGTIRHVSLLVDEITEQDVLILIYSIRDPWAEVLNALPCKKILLYSNVTPPEFFQIYDAELAAYCAKSYEQVAQLANFDQYVTNSQKTARDLIKLQAERIDPKEEQRLKLLKDSSEALQEFFPNASVVDIDHAVEKLSKHSEAETEEATPLVAPMSCPPFITLNRWKRSAAAAIKLPKASERLLFVGRVAPNKKIEDLFLFMEEYKKRSPEACLLIVGGSSFAGYRHYLDHLLESRHAAICKDIYFLDDVTDQELRAVYEGADAFLTMSEHEGYCIPIVEAMSFDLPVFAYADEAICETLGDAGRVFHQKVFSDIAEEVFDVLDTPEKTERFLAAQRTRLSEIAVESNGAVIWKALESLV